MSLLAGLSSLAADPKAALEALRGELSAAQIHLLPDGDAVLEGILWLLRPDIHENSIVPMGLVSGVTVTFPLGTTRLSADTVSLQRARSLSDGLSSFVVYEEGIYTGLAILPMCCSDEDELVSLQALTGAVVGVTDDEGITRIFRAEGVAIHRLRVWRSKPPVEVAVRSLIRHSSAIDTARARHLISFCYHRLSPARIGATVVWYLREPAPQSAARAVATLPLVELGLDLVTGTNLPLLESLLARHDGAVLVQTDGRVTGLGAQLSVSERAERIIPAAPGTRHTSARRYSYDCTEALVFTVSADGPVSIFSDGLKLTELGYDSELDAAFLRAVAPDRDDIEHDTWDEQCDKCGKTSLVSDIFIPGWRERESVDCPVCGEELISRKTFQLTARLVKRL